MAVTATGSTEIKDWRGTPIITGSKVLYNYGGYRGIGTVMGFVKKPYTSQWFLELAWHEHSNHSRKKSLPVQTYSVTVLTKDMFDDA